MSWADTLPARLRASGIHFLLSLLVFLGLLFFILYRWYPIPFFSTDGGWQGVRIMIGVDLVLGPLLTFLVFNPNKSLRMILVDLGVISLIQVSAIIWGVYAVHSQRPVAVVFWDNQFYSVKAEDFAAQQIDPGELDQYSRVLPPLIYARQPEGEAEVMKTLSLGMENIAEWHQLHLYSRLVDSLDELDRRTLEIETFAEDKPWLQAALADFLANHNGVVDDYLFARFSGSYSNAILILDRQGNLVDSLVYPD